MKYMNFRWLTIPVCTLLAALLMNAGALLNYGDTSLEKVPALISGPRTQISDNYFYFTLLRHAPERWSASPTDSLDPDGGDHRHVNSISSSYAPALYAGYFLYRISTIITHNPRDALQLTIIFHTWILAACLVVFILTLINKQKKCAPSLILILAMLSIVGIDAFGFSAYYGFPYWDRSLLLNEPNPVRLINPTLFWSVGLLAAIYVVRWLRDGRNTDLLFGAGIAFLCCVISISVGAALLGAIGLSVILNALKIRSISWMLIVIFLSGLVGLIWTYLQLIAYASTPLGMDLRHGEFDHFIFKWQFLVFLIFIPLLQRWLRAEHTFIISLLVVSVSIGVVCDSFHLGGRLWLRGGVIFVWAITLFLLLRIVFLIEPHVGRIIKYFAKSILIIVFFIFVVNSQNRGSDSWTGFIHKDKAELYEWIDNNIKPNSIVASEDIEDAFLIPVYTSSKSVFSSIGMTNRTLDEEMRRFFFTMNLYGSSFDVAKNIIEVEESDFTKYYNHIFSNASPFKYSGQKADAIIFLRNVIYIPYIKRFSNILRGQEQHNVFASTINQLEYEGRNSIFQFDYAILNRNKQRPINFIGWKIIHSNDNYDLLVNPH